MKISCKKNLYWHQKSGYSGSLNEGEVSLCGEDVIIAFKVGRKYEVYPAIASSGLSYISIRAVGEDNKKYAILNDELHCGVTGLALRHFNFSEIYEREKDEIDAKTYADIIEQLEICKRELGFSKICEEEKMIEVLLKPNEIEYLLKNLK